MHQRDRRQKVRGNSRLLLNAAMQQLLRSVAGRARFVNFGFSLGPCDRHQTMRRWLPVTQKEGRNAAEENARLVLTGQIIS